jgi:hypothetical protein
MKLLREGQTDPNGIAVRLVEWVPPARSPTDHRPTADDIG